MKLLLLPRVITECIAVDKLLQTLPSESPKFFIEVFAGECTLTLGIVASKIPAVRPWDVRHDEAMCVLRNGKVLLKLFGAGYIQLAHFATPCRINSFVRERQLRSYKHVRGKPDISAHERALVRDSNDMADWTLVACKVLHEA